MNQMASSLEFPLFEEYVPSLNAFICDLVDDYNMGQINSWADLEKRVKAFFLREKMNEVERIAPGWKKMASYSGGVTLTHVICVLLGLFIMPEFQNLAPSQQQLAKWIVLFHDLEKMQIRGKRDHVHAFHSAATTARALKGIGFSATDRFDQTIDPWCRLVRSAATERTNYPGEMVADNCKLPEIMAGIDEMYGNQTPGALIVKGVLFHMSIDVVRDWPQPAPLTEGEIIRFIDKALLPLLKVMHLADNEGWNLFEQERGKYRRETLDVFDGIERMMHAENLS